MPGGLGYTSDAIASIPSEKKSAFVVYPAQQQSKSCECTLTKMFSKHQFCGHCMHFHDLSYTTSGRMNKLECGL